MNRIIIILVFSFFSTVSFAQFGLTAGAKIMNIEEFVSPFPETGNSNDFLYNHFYLGLDYWFRLEKKRIEFLPTLGYESGTVPIGMSEDKLQLYSFFLNTNFYIFDFEGDCNCPTFSKGGNFIEKGLFLQVTPGVSYINSKATITQTNGDLTEIKDKSFNFGIGIGAGLDIGLSDFLTVTPIVSYYLIPSVKRTNFGAETIGEGESVEANIKQLNVAFRIGIRLNE